ncbi:antirestriction protein ArdA [Rhodococcus aetherivorans]|uniref:antirestriction protein ArdA n=1 Tax=Rhodococcus aetherivorans TaxID=191292 RepID=UPI00294961BE|nr:antirestriction protein ArdA [Rhodococcus aetherivorans]MDV6291489.1 antirestriction protein ArdA [Rhodococcus aetherivorans]
MSHKHPSIHSEQEASSEHPSTPSPRVYVASLADYNAGRLHGVWLDADRDPAELQADIQAMLAASPESGAEEYAIHDSDGFGDARLDEFDSLELVSRIAHGIAAHGLAFAAWADIQAGDETALDRFEEAYLGHYDSEQAYAEQLIDDLGYQQLLDHSVPASLRPYARIDTEALARDMQLDGDLHFYPADDGGVWIFDGRV